MTTIDPFSAEALERLIRGTTDRERYVARSLPFTGGGATHRKAPAMDGLDAIRRGLERESTCRQKIGFHEIF